MTKLAPEKTTTPHKTESLSSFITNKETETIEKYFHQKKKKTQLLALMVQIVLQIFYREQKGNIFPSSR